MNDEKIKDLNESLKILSEALSKCQNNSVDSYSIIICIRNITDKIMGLS